MIHTSNLRWGLHSFPPLEALAAFGARTIFQNGKIDFLPDRRDCLGETDVCNALCSWINHKALPALNEHIKNHAWTPKTHDTFTLENGLYRFEASPCASAGYLYMTGCMKGFDKFPAGKWSGSFIPEIGEKVTAVVNNIGECRVLGYFLEDGWDGVIARPENPPEWVIRQNGGNAVCGLFGAEIREAIPEQFKQREMNDAARNI